MEQPKLGTLSKIDLRKIWPNEAANFTPWLAVKENLSKLGAAVGMELEAEHTEVACGRQRESPRALWRADPRLRRERSAISSVPDA